MTSTEFLLAMLALSQTIRTMQYVSKVRELAKRRRVDKIVERKVHEILIRSMRSRMEELKKQNKFLAHEDVDKLKEIHRLRRTMQMK